MNTTLETKEGAGLQGSFVMRGHRAGDIKWHRDEFGKVVVDYKSLKAAMGAPIYKHPRVKNLIVSSSGYGRNLLLRQMSGDTAYPILIDSGAIGTGNTAPADGNTALVTPVLSAIGVALFELSNDSLVISFFIPDGDLANGTYKEFAMFMGTQMFSRAIISPDYSKSSGIDTTIEYTVNFTA